MFFESDRLLFRQWRDEDKKIFCELNSDPVVMEFFPNPLAREESDRFVDKTVKFIAQNQWGLFAVELKDEGRFIGFIGLATPSFEMHFTPCTEIGWRLHKNFWKKGYATEGAKAVLNFAFNNLKKKEIVSFTSKLNLPSIAVMERIGMKHDPDDDFEHPKLKETHPLKPHVLYRIKKEDWEP